MRNRHSTTREGITLIEIVAAVSILAVLLASSVQVTSALSQHQRAAERRALAMETAQALVEQLSNMRWNDLVPQAAERLAVPREVRPFLPGAKLEAAVVEERQPVAAKRVSIKLTWTAPGGGPAGPVRLTAWAFPDESLRQE